jgi:ribonuclease BN (tRNA processing enzyme)
LTGAVIRRDTPETRIRPLFSSLDSETLESAAFFLAKLVLGAYIGCNVIGMPIPENPEKVPSVRVRFLGSGDAFGSGGRLQTCILIESGGFHSLVDCGASSLIALKRAAVDPNDVATILVSHLHGDHFGGLPFFILDGQFSRRTDRLLVAGPPGLAERVTQAMEILFPGSPRAHRKFETAFLEFTDGTPTTIGCMRVTPFEVVHACGAPPYALRIELDGRTIVYSGDTEWTDRLIPAAAGADLFIAEAYHYEKSVRFHLDYATLVQHCDQLGYKRLIITHMGPDMLARAAALPVEAAHDGLQVLL